ncbi:MAG TPA: NHLP leader peptide family RiPP precursor [Longimicrobiaceae bacterium]|nr:NHLP leader peptide family RiPP precursor [Longimicrobiaceae bacterium]
MLVQSDKQRTLLALVTARAWRDAWYRQRLLDDAASALREEGVSVPEGVTVRVLEDSDSVKHMVVPDAATAAEQLERVRRCLPLLPGCELRVVRAGPGTRCFVLTMPPADASFGDFDLDLLVASTDPTTAETSQVAEAVTTESTRSWSW